MNNIPTSGANHPHNNDVSSSAAATSQFRSALVTQAVGLGSNIPAMNSTDERTTSLLTLTEARDTAAQRADYPELGQEGVKYSSSPLAQIRPAWQAFSSKVVDGVLKLDGKLGAEETHDLAEWLKSSPPEVLTLWLKTNFSNQGADLVQLAEALKVNTTLTSLYIYFNNLGAASAGLLAGALKVNTTLTTLDLFLNNIGDAGAAALAAMLKVNRTLTSVSLGCNNIADVGAAALAGALEVNHALSVLSVDSNEIRSAGATALAKALKSNRSLTALHIEGNPICFDGAAGAAELVEALKVNAKLTTLDVSNTGFGAAELAGLRQTLKVNTTLTTLTIKNNNSGMKYGYMHSADDTTPEITALLQRNQHLSQRLALAGVALDLASGQQYPAEVVALIAAQLPLVPVGQREAALSTLQQLSTSVETPPSAD